MPRWRAPNLTIRERNALDQISAMEWPEPTTRSATPADPETTRRPDPVPPPKRSRKEPEPQPGGLFR